MFDFFCLFVEKVHINLIKITYFYKKVQKNNKNKLYEKCVLL